MSVTKVLIVSANPLTRSQLQAEAGRQGVEVDIFRSAAEAMAQFARGKYCKALVDYVMSPVNGLVLSKALKRLDKDLPITLLTHPAISGCKDTVLYNKLTKDTSVENVIRYAKG